MRHGYRPRRTPPPGPRYEPRIPRTVDMELKGDVLQISRPALEALKKMCAPDARKELPGMTLSNTFGWTRIEVVSHLPYTRWENARMRQRREWMMAEASRIDRLREQREFRRKATLLSALMPPGYA